jgi:hypothetical protein
MKVLRDLSNLDLISIKSETTSKKELKNLLKKLRSNDDKISLDEITKEVEAVRNSRYEK